MVERCKPTSKAVTNVDIRTMRRVFWQSRATMNEADAKKQAEIVSGRARNTVHKYLGLSKGAVPPPAEQKKEGKTEKPLSKRGNSLPKSVIEELKSVLEQSYASHSTEQPWKFSAHAVQQKLYEMGYEVSRRTAQGIVAEQLNIKYVPIDKLPRMLDSTWDQVTLMQFYINYLLLMELCENTSGFPPRKRWESFRPKCLFPS